MNSGSQRAFLLVSSDVSARGVDYPDVTLVIQVGSMIGSLVKGYKNKTRVFVEKFI